MEILLNTAILPPPLHRFPKLRFYSQQKRSLQNCSISCSRLEGDGNNEVSQSSNEKNEAKPNEIWQLFREAQQNILYLNKLRLKAVEELNKSNREKKQLLDRLEQLEPDRKMKDKSSMCWELLFRVDSMVLTGMISIGEASELRGLVMDCKYSVADNISSDIKLQGDAEILAELRRIKEVRNGLHIIHICTEMAPLVSVGSSASYVTGLSHALQRKGHLVEVILPKYTNLDLNEVQGLRETKVDLYSYFDGQLHGNRIWTGVCRGIGVTFIEPLKYSSFFSREKVYGHEDDFERFSYFSRASLDYIVKSGKRPAVLHIHNWETSIVGPLFWDIFVDQGLGDTKILLTCHGFDSQCLVQPDKLSLCGLDPARLTCLSRLQDNTNTHLINILKGGIVYSNKVVILSSIHSKGRIIRCFNHGMEPTIAAHKDKLVVSPYGFDSSTWDCSKDGFLPENYSGQDMKGKTVCKAVLQERLGLSKQASDILVGCIVSEVQDMDLKNLKAVVQNAIKRGVQVVTYSRTVWFYILKYVLRPNDQNLSLVDEGKFIFMDEKAANVTREMQFLKELEDENVRFINSYDEALSHLIFGGSDIILCQSFDDPILQVPHKALKYGAAPIAITTENGFSHFMDNNYEPSKFSQFINSTFGNMSLTQAIDELENDPTKWKQKMTDAMEKDFSWNAECYDIHLSAYNSIVNL